MTRRKQIIFAFSCGLTAALTGACENDDKGSLDADGDGFDIDEDCDDNDADVHPSAVEICDDGVDNDCDGVDASCYVDFDGDGWLSNEDCDDSHPDINPGMAEDCMTGVDDNCDGVVSECAYASLIYEPTGPGPVDSYDAAVFADLVVFGDPGGGFSPPGDGRALWFPSDAGLVTELDAVLTSDGTVAAKDGYGLGVAPVGDHLCITGDYYDDGATTNVGKSWCYSEATVRAASSTLALSSAAFTTAGEVATGFSKLDAEADVDGDGNLDLLVYTARDVQVILGSGAPWSGDYRVPSGADLSLGGCASSTTDWCGFGRTLTGSVLALVEEGGNDTVSLYGLPLTLPSPTPTASVVLERGHGDSSTDVALISGVAIGNSLDREINFVDGSGNVGGVAIGPYFFGYWTSSFIDARGHELLIASAPYELLEQGTGVVYVFDLTAHGLPNSHEEAKYVLVPPDNFFQCGMRARGGLVRDGNGTWTVIASACPSTGGAAYRLNFQLDPAPLVSAADIWSPEQGQYRIRQWVVDAYTSELEWLNSLAQTEAVIVQGNVVGWRLHAVTPGSPLFRAGLRKNDVIKRVNGIDASSPAVVNQLFDTFVNASNLTLGIIRNGTPRTLSYTIVP